jgi:hypothetical protein
MTPKLTLTTNVRHQGGAMYNVQCFIDGVFVKRVTVRGKAHVQGAVDKFMATNTIDLYAMLSSKLEEIDERIAELTTAANEIRRVIAR